MTPTGSRAAALLLAAAGLLASCQTETRTMGDGASDAAARGGWVVGGVGGGAKEREKPPEEPTERLRPPGVYVEVPVEAYRPVDLFFDNEGYLLGDRISVDCSFNPFRGRMAGVGTIGGSGDHSEGYVASTEWEEGDLYCVRLKNRAAGPAYQENLVPKVTFGSIRVLEGGTEMERPTIRPFFEFVGTEEILVRFHRTSSPERPVWFEARADGTATPSRPGEIRECIYVNANRRRRVKGAGLALTVEIRRGPDGAWSPVIDDPAPGAGRLGGR